MKFLSLFTKRDEGLKAKGHDFKSRKRAILAAREKQKNTIVRAIQDQQKEKEATLNNLYPTPFTAITPALIGDKVILTANEVVNAGHDNAIEGKLAINAKQRQEEYIKMDKIRHFVKTAAYIVDSVFVQRDTDLHEFVKLMDDPVNLSVVQSILTFCQDVPDKRVVIALDDISGGPGSHYINISIQFPNSVSAHDVTADLNNLLAFKRDMEWMKGVVTRDVTADRPWSNASPNVWWAHKLQKRHKNYYPITIINNVIADRVKFNNEINSGSFKNLQQSIDAVDTTRGAFEEVLCIDFVVQLNQTEQQKAASMSYDASEIKAKVCAY